MQSIETAIKSLFTTKTEPSPGTTVVPDAAPAELEGKMEEITAENIPPPGNKEENEASESESEGESDSESDDNTSSDDDDDDNTIANSKENVDGISEYERLRLERIERNQAQLRQLGLIKLSESAPKKKSHRKSTNNSAAPPKNLVAARRQPQREGKGRITYFSQEQLELMNSNKASQKSKKNFSKNKSQNRCGTCEGCLRENDCNTCVYCHLRSQGAKTRRCIFKACRNKDKNKQREKKNDDNDKTPQQDEHSHQCDICQTGGDLILCDACPRGFHSNCHFPKIKKLPPPNSEWLCMECNPTHSSKNILVALMPDTTKLIQVKVIEPPPECMACLADCTLPAESINCKACDLHFHLACLPSLTAKPKGGAAKVWKCEACKAANKPLLEQYTASTAAATKPKTPKKKKKLKLFQGEHDDDCYICINGGELVCCDFCPKVFHRKCHIPALPAIPTGIWKCCECYASERNRMTRCGECKACMAEDCGKCKFCLDRPKFGGNNKLKKPCVHRECPYQSFAETFVEGKIPGEITHSAAAAAAASNSKKRRRESDASSSQGKKKQTKKTEA